MDYRKKKKQVTVFETTVNKNCFSNFLVLCDSENWNVVYNEEFNEHDMLVSVVLEPSDIFSLGYMIGLLESGID